jgi:molecular chaperone DnaJ
MDLYIVLGVQHDATESDIKRAYRRLARRYHPDINPGDQSAAMRFRQVMEAYEVLIDREQRHRYDQGQPPASPESPRSGFEGFDFTASGAAPAATFGDLFAEVLVDRAARSAAPLQRGADLHQEVRLSFEDALTGLDYPLTITRRELCRTCAGTGAIQLQASPCATCEGTGAVRSVRGHMVFSRSCGACGGTGQRRPRACQACAGSGREVRSEAVSVGIPPGVVDGERLRVPGKGDAGVRGAEAGDLYVTVWVRPHEHLRREGDDIHMVLPVAIHEAALGARVDVSGPYGVVKLRVPPGTQSGQRFRLRGRGAASTRRPDRGDLVVEIRLMLPPLLDEQSKELLRQFGRINGTSVRSGASHGEAN